MTAPGCVVLEDHVFEVGAAGSRRVGAQEFWVMRWCPWCGYNDPELMAEWTPPRRELSCGTSP